MPDITMCTGGECSKKDTCYRYRAWPSRQRQSYFIVPPSEPDDQCEHHMILSALALVPSRSLEQIDIDELALEKRLIARLNNPAAEASS